MKLDKESLILIVICIGFAFAWQPLCVYMGWSAPASAAVSASAPAAASAPVPAASAPAQAAAVPGIRLSVAIPKLQQPIVQLPPAVIQNTHLQLRFDPNRGEISEITLLDYRNASRTGFVTLDRAGAKYGALSLNPVRMNWQLSRTPKVKQLSQYHLLLMREFSTPSGSVGLLQEWQLAEKGYTTLLRYTLCNLDSQPQRFDDLVLTGGNLAPWQAVSGDKVRIPSHRMDFLTASGGYTDVAADKKDSKFFQQPAPAVEWAAVSNKYFCSILDTATPFTLWQDRFYRTFKEGEKETPVIAVGAALESFTLAPGGKRVLEYRFYSGPKVISELQSFKPGTGKVMHLAWGPLDYLARGLLWILVQLHKLCGSYGWSIILLTILVRLVFYPLTARGNASMNKMRIVQPQLKELRDKYKDNPQLMNQKMMELYRKAGVNPFGGCLPILLQIPVFFALYATLDGAVELRQVPFYWCRDLAAADTVARINLGFYMLPVNPLALAMTALMVLQQQLTPMSMDPAQKKMMLLMPVVMLLFLYDLPSGLTLYWTVSNIFSIIQLRLQQKRSPLPAADVASVAPAAQPNKRK